MRNVTGQKFFGFMGKNTGLTLPRVGFRPREDPRRGVAVDQVYLSRSAVFNYYNTALDRLARNEQSGKLMGDFKARNRGAKK